MLGWASEYMYERMNVYAFVGTGLRLVLDYKCIRVYVYKWKCRSGMESWMKRERVDRIDRCG